MPGYEGIVEALEIRKKCFEEGCFEKRLNDRYSVGVRIGTGGLSEVFEAEDAYALRFGDRRRLAVKLPSKALREKEDVDAFVYAEYAHLLRLCHPGVIRVFDFGIDPDLELPYIVLERLQGRLLGTVSPSGAGTEMKMRLLQTLFGAVEYLHAHGIVHADINPTNIMCLDDGSFRLFDFGIAVDLHARQPCQIDYRAVRAFNPLYAAPEVALGAVPDTRSDLYSLSAVLLEFFAGGRKRPAPLRKQPPSKQELAPLPSGLRSWFGRALSPDPAERPQEIPQKYHIGN
jgi:serine/threonine protein kinase